MSDTTLPSRALLLTPPGTAAIAVVRLIGPAVEPFLRQFFSATPRIGRPVHGFLREGGRVLDDPVVVRIDPQQVDLNIHGGPWVIQSVLELARQNGFEIIDPAPLPLDHAAMDESEPLLREMESHLPLARTDLSLRALLAQPDAWRNVQRTFMAESPARQTIFIQQCLRDRALHYLLFTPTVAIIGSPNVGKSTLANQLFAQTRSITADQPGTTRDWVGEIADIDGLPVLLIDTAGIRQTPDPLENAAIEQSHHQARQADLVMIVLDSTRPADAHEQQLLDQYPHALLIFNKCDLPRSSPFPDTSTSPSPDTSTSPSPGTPLSPVPDIHRSPSPGIPGEGRGEGPAEGRAEGSPTNPPLSTIATTGQGIDALRRRITTHFHCDSLDHSRPRCWTDRQRKILFRAMENPQVLSQL